VILGTSNKAQPAISETDSLALVALYNSTDGDHWIRNDNWLTGPVRSWWGITINGSNVKEINLVVNENLDIGNNLVGSIPNEIGDLAHLVKLDMSFNQLSGNIPHEIWQLSDLIFLSFWGNQLIGEIPDEIGQLNNLEVLILFGNQLTGSIPHEIGLLTKLYHLDLGDCIHLSGNIPSEIWQLLNLNYLDLSGNQLIGNIPEDIGNLTNLGQLNLQGNQLSGNIPSEIGQLTNLTKLNFQGNYLTGIIPPEIGQLKNLTHLLLGNNNNQLSGPIPPEIGQLKNLQVLDLNRNRLTGNIPPEIGQLTSLLKIDLSNNLLTGNIPSELGNLTLLQDLILSSNQLSGSIPIEIGNLRNLWRLQINYNHLTGTIPTEIGFLIKLRELQLVENQLSGTIPPGIGNLIMMTDLRLSNNRLTGTIPAELGNLTQMMHFYCNDNFLSGNLPAELVNMNKQLKDFIISNNQFIGEVPSGIGGIDSLRRVQIGNNYFTEIPFFSTVSSEFHCQSNQLTFEDLERNVSVIRNDNIDINYSPQLSFGRDYDTMAIEGNRFGLSIFCGGKYNHYKWFKDGIQLSGVPDISTLTFSKIQLTDAGIYHITVTNDSVPNLELTSLPVHLNVEEHCMKQDSLALVALYNATGGTNWTRNDNWLTGSVSSWFGITTDSCNVTEVKLVINDTMGLWEGNNLQGVLPPVIGDLTHLTQLVLHTNQLSGSIPAEIGKLTSLVRLDMERNQLTGSLPPEIGNLSQLQSLTLDDNQLTGSIPPEIGKLGELTEINFDRNQLTGDIPLELYNLKKLRHLWIDRNLLTGEISPLIGELTQLQGLGLGNNQLSGIIPIEIGLLTNLRNLHLGNNLITGEIPHEIGDLTELDFLVLGGGRSPLSGEIPLEFYNCTKLQYVYLHGNDFTGEINPLIGNLTELVLLYIDGNRLSGVIPTEICSLTKLERLGLAYNRFTGNIPDGIMYLNTLNYFYISENLFDGIPDLSAIDSSFCSNNKLTFEDFERNLDAIKTGSAFIEYIPQLPFSHEYDTTAIEENPFTLSIPCGGIYNHYKWYKDGIQLTGAPDASDLVFQSIQLSDAGTYHITVTNDSVPDLELTSLPVHLNVLNKNLRRCTIKAYIDSQSLLVIQSDSVQWHHLNGAAPGRHGGVNLPTYICGEEWFPVWPDIPDPDNRQECYSSVYNNPSFSLPEFPQNVILTIIEAEGNVTILEQPSANNNYSLILFFDDGEPPGPYWYEISITWNILEAPEAPTLLLPDNNAENQPATPSLIWESAERANFYIIKISTLPDFSSSLTLIDEISDTILTVEELSLATNYYWKVGAVNETDTTWSETWQFTTVPPIPNAPKLLSPGDGTRNLSFDLILTWIESTFASGYTIQISTSANFDDMIIDSINISNTNFSVSNLQENTLYYWRVNASNVAGVSNWSDVWSFTTQRMKRELKPINLVIIDGSRNPNFIIENIDDYPENNLKVYTKWGKLIYKKNSFNNELDLRSYTEGTYYYILFYETDDGDKQLKGFFDVVKK
jgi:Leucine-rich repeat (LRR) protein